MSRSSTCTSFCAVVGAASTEGEGSIGALLIFDLPFSLVMDTVFLPLSIYEQITGNWPLRREPKAVPDTADAPPPEPPPPPRF